MQGTGEAGFIAHEFQGASYEKGPSKGRLDYIWYRGQIQPVQATIIKDGINEKYPIDHFFMQTDFVAG